MTKKERERKKYGLRLPKIAESDPGSWYVWIWWVPSINKRTPAKIHSLLALTLIDPATGWFEIVEATK
jgi:hypothetical protein